ncbi:MAG: hypothetical protein C4519_01025 [Desulfobacteraceae bacterium]|nr:MAG: hypothetical protein C4519_01025 [Desulfobacteraceae bacterium]
MIRQNATVPRIVFLRRYLAFVLMANLAWEILHLPLYTIWQEGNPKKLAWAVIHCTAGDLLIASGSLLLAVILAGGRAWPLGRFIGVVATSIALGVSYTVWSEWLNTSVNANWNYSEWMPIIPGIRVGLSPIAQWIVVPLLGFWWARRGLASMKTGPPGISK